MKQVILVRLFYILTGYHLNCIEDWILKVGI